MLESRAKEIVLEDVRKPIFLALLEYLYTDEVEIPLDIAMELFQVSDFPCVMTTLCIHNVCAHTSKYSDVCAVHHYDCVQYSCSATTASFAVFGVSAHMCISLQ
jgi:BTB/POZ domain